MSDTNTQESIKKKYFEKVGVFFCSQGYVKESKNDYISAPAADLAKPVFR
jgi:hypothetical protein